MGFDIYLLPSSYDPNRGRRAWWQFWKRGGASAMEVGDDEDEDTGGERLFDAGGFFALAEALGNTLHILRESGVSLDLGDEEMIPMVAAWEAYIADAPKKHRRSFVKYCDFMRGAFQKLQRQFGPMQMIGGADLHDVKASEFHPDVQAALGRALLPSGPHSPEEAAALVPIAFFIGGLLARMSGHLREEGQVEQADQLQEVAMSLTPLVNLASKASDEGRWLVVDY